MRKNIAWQKNSLAALDMNIAQMKRDVSLLEQKIHRAQQERQRLYENILFQEAGRDHASSSKSNIERIDVSFDALPAGLLLASR